MDKEEREALELSKDDLLAMAAEAKAARVARRRPLRVRKKQDLNQRAAAIVEQATEESGFSVSESEGASVVITGARFRPEEPVTFPTHQSVTIIP